LTRLQFTPGEILTAANMNTLSDSTVMQFASAAARGSAIPSPVEGMVTYLEDAPTNNAAAQFYDGSAWGAIGHYTARSVITATNASWPVPTLASPIVRVTVIGGGGGGGAAQSNFGGNGGTSSFTVSSGTVSAAGGLGGLANDTGTNGQTGAAGFAAANFGTGGNDGTRLGGPGTGGEIRVGYVNLTGISTANVVVGAGGSGGSAGIRAGGTGGRGEVIVDYVAG
jgi:hypothetical protein